MPQLSAHVKEEVACNLPDYHFHPTDPEGLRRYEVKDVGAMPPEIARVAAVFTYREDIDDLGPEDCHDYTHCSAKGTVERRKIRPVDSKEFSLHVTGKDLEEVLLLVNMIKGTIVPLEEESETRDQTSIQEEECEGEQIPRIEMQLKLARSMSEAKDKEIADLKRERDGLKKELRFSEVHAHDAEQRSNELLGRLRRVRAFASRLQSSRWPFCSKQSIAGQIDKLTSGGKEECTEG